MTNAAGGERQAVRGYKWQYDQLAARVYDALLDETFVNLRLVDPSVGKVDDLVLVTVTGSIGHQYKSQEHPGSLTLNDLLVARTTTGGKPAPSLLRELADGWVVLAAESGVATVHLVTNKYASVNDRLGESTDPDRPSPDNFAVFLTNVAEPLRRGDLNLADVPAGWKHALARMQTETGLADDQFAAFLRALHIQVHQPNPLQTADPVRRHDIEILSDALFRRVSESTGVVVLDREQVLALAGWNDRTRLRSTHEFTVDIDTYEPLDAAIDALSQMLSTTVRGYLALVGPPGSGKSTLLTQALSGRAERIIRYYAYVPRGGSSRNRLEAHGFLHDLVLMLGRAAGVNRGHLLDTTVPALRTALHELLEQAGDHYAESDEKTIVVVDGLDHVQRDHPGVDSLLAELPRPQDLRDGVIFIVGTRTLEPLQPETREQVSNAGRLLDLGGHRLSDRAVLNICRRAAGARNLGDEVHQRIAVLAAGHPLSLAYLLNKAAAFDDPSTALAALEGSVAYDGDIAAAYRAIWDRLDPDDQELLAVVARLRIHFTYNDLVDWFGNKAARTFHEDLAHLFRQHGHAWTVFHDSFRQYVIKHSNLDNSRSIDDPLWDAGYHAEIAARCATAGREMVRWEELYHRHLAGEDISAYASQASFREQTIGLRSPEAIREDITIALRDAARRRDLAAFVTALLGKVEFEGRLNTLEQIDVAGTYLGSGMLAEAVAFSGVDQRRQISLDQAYNLAARLGVASDTAGRRVFDTADSRGFEDEDFSGSADRRNNVYEAWAAAAPLYRPMSLVIDVLRSMWPSVQDDVDDEQPGFMHRGPTLTRFDLMARAICQTLVDVGRLDELIHVDTLLQELDTGIDEGGKDRGRRQATVLEVRLAIARHRADNAPNEGEAHAARQRGVDALVVPMFVTSMLTWAHIALDLGHDDLAERLIERRELGRRLTTRDVGYRPNVELRERFEYWRARHRIHRRDNPDRLEAVLDSTAPEGGGAGESAFRDFAAEELTDRIDHALRVLGAAAAAVDEGAPYDMIRLWSELVPILSIGTGLSSSSATFSGIRGHRDELTDIIVDVVALHGGDALQRLAERLGSRFNEQPDEWHLTRRLRIGANLTQQGHTPSWYQAAVVTYEAEVPDSDLDISGRLEAIVELVGHYENLGQRGDAQRLAKTLIPMSFGVGFRKDYQFERWTDMFEAAVNSGLANAIDEATNLARLLRVAAPMTEGAPRESAAALLRSIGRHYPGAGVALFEYLVRHGTIDHLDGLGELLTGLVPGLGGDEPALRICADLVTDMLAAADQHAHPRAARAVADACRDGLPSDVADAVIGDLRARLESYPLPTTRWDWLDAIGFPAGPPDLEDLPNGDSTYGHLSLEDGRVLSRTEVIAIATSAADVLELRRAENAESSFDWVPVLERLEIDGNDLEALARLFNGNQRRDADAVLHLGHRWLHQGHRDRASECAEQALSGASDDSWTRSWGSTRRKAHELAVAAGGEVELQRAWDDLADCVGDKTWRAEMILRDLHEVTALLETSADPVALWPLVREHLDGMIVSITLDTEEPLECQPIRWWTSSASPHLQRLDGDDTASEALGVLVVDHATHPAWRLRDAAIATGSKNVQEPESTVARAIGVIVLAGAPDDMFETLGRIASFADPTSNSNMTDIHEKLGASENAFIRSLSARRGEETRPLPGRYRLVVLPDGNQVVLGDDDIELWPFEPVVARLADLADLDPDQLIAHAKSAMRQAQEIYPSNTDVRQAFAGAELKLMWAHPSAFIARTIVGRMVRDFEAAGLLDDLDPGDRRLLRTFDPLLVTIRPGKRPQLVPPAPLAGHDPNMTTWVSSTAQRLTEYVDALGNGEDLVIAARARATVLNWGHLEERFASVTALGPPPESPALEDADATVARSLLLRDLTRPVEAHPFAGAGRRLAIQNEAWRFHQIEADWLSFHPIVAASLGWTPVEDEPGTWLTAAGDVAVRTVRWVDGWWGHAGPAFDDTEGDGVLVVATPAGASDLNASHPEIGRVSRLHRNGHSTDSGERVTDSRAEVVGDLIAW